jgi:hypothetical protein
MSSQRQKQIDTTRHHVEPKHLIAEEKKICDPVRKYLQAKGAACQRVWDIAAKRYQEEEERR